MRLTSTAPQALRQGATSWRPLVKEPMSLEYLGGSNGEGYSRRLWGKRRAQAHTRTRQWPLPAAAASWRSNCFQALLPPHTRCHLRKVSQHLEKGPAGAQALDPVVRQAAGGRERRRGDARRIARSVRALGDRCASVRGVWQRQAAAADVPVALAPSTRRVSPGDSAAFARGANRRYFAGGSLPWPLSSRPTHPIATIGLLSA